MNTVNTAAVSNNSEELVVNGGPSSVSIESAAAASTIKNLLKKINFDSEIDKLEFARFLVSGIIAYDHAGGSVRISPPAMMVIESKTPACGKTILANFFCNLFDGYYVLGGMELAAVLNAKKPIAVIDNYRSEKISDSFSDSVAKAVTAGLFSGRKLGEVSSSMMQTPLIVSTCLSGTKFTQDMERRVVRVELRMTDEFYTVSVDDFHAIRSALRTLVSGYTPDEDCFTGIDNWKSKMDEFLKPVFRLS